MFENRVDQEKNWLYIRIVGKISASEAYLASQDILVKIKALKPGFGVISDIAELSPDDSEGWLIIGNIMRIIEEEGMGQVVRIINDTTSQKTAMQWRQSSLQAGYIAREVSSLEEAEKLLDTLEKTLEKKRKKLSLDF